MPTVPRNDARPEATAGVSMHQLLASCAAARVVSTPPAPPGERAEEALVPVTQDSHRTPAGTPEPRRREAA